MILREISIARTLHAGCHRHFMFKRDSNVCAFHGLAVLINHHILHIRWLADTEQPIFAEQAHKPVHTEIISMGLAGYIFAAVIGHSTFDHQFSIDNFWRSRRKSERQLSLVVHVFVLLEYLLRGNFVLVAVKGEILCQWVA